jgi:hypothetical protein
MLIGDCCVLRVVAGISRTAAPACSTECAIVASYLIDNDLASICDAGHTTISVSLHRPLAEGNHCDVSNRCDSLAAPAERPDLLIPIGCVTAVVTVCQALTTWLFDDYKPDRH